MLGNILHIIETGRPDAEQETESTIEANSSNWWTEAANSSSGDLLAKRRREDLYIVSNEFMECPLLDEPSTKHVKPTSSSLEQQRKDVLAAIPVEISSSIDMSEEILEYDDVSISFSHVPTTVVDESDSHVQGCAVTLNHLNLSYTSIPVPQQIEMCEAYKSRNAKIVKEIESLKGKFAITNLPVKNDLETTLRCKFGM